MPTTCLPPLHCGTSDWACMTFFSSPFSLSAHMPCSVIHLLFLSWFSEDIMYEYSFFRWKIPLTIIRIFFPSLSTIVLPFLIPMQYIARQRCRNSHSTPTCVRACTMTCAYRAEMFCAPLHGRFDLQTLTYGAGGFHDIDTHRFARFRRCDKSPRSCRAPDRKP